MFKFAAFSIDDNNCRTAYRFFTLPEEAIELVGRLERNADAAFLLVDLQACLASHGVIANNIPWAEEQAEEYSPFFDLGHLDHNQRELTLMLGGLKPLAVFSVSSGCPLSDATNQDFESYTESKRIFEERFQVKGSKSNPDWDFLMYCLPGEEWRMKGYLLVYDNSRRYGFDMYTDAIFSDLLGYSPKEVDRYMAYRRKQSSSSK
jgi:hypothetical protein